MQVYVANAVIRIGRNRVLDASINASVTSNPFRRLCSTRSNNTTAFVTTIPISISNPIIALIDNVCFPINKAKKAPTGTNISDDKITNGVLNPPNVMLMIKNTNPTATTIAIPKLLKSIRNHI